MKKAKPPLFSGTEWSFDNLVKGWEVIDKLGKKYNWEGYPVKFEIITSEQMIDKYVSTGLPQMYSHWSFGKQFIRQQAQYHNHNSLAYELVINTSPSICYIMENNTQMVQLLVTAHAAVGHNHFFKNNYLFKLWTDPEGVVDYLNFATHYIKLCREKYGTQEVELILDWAHSLKSISYSRYKKPHKNKIDANKLRRDRLEHLEKNFDVALDDASENERIKKNILKNPDRFVGEENMLYFLEKTANQPDWVKEILRIVRKINQYFYPQMQTQLMNEGFASFVHYTLMNDLRVGGYIDDGYMLDFFENHTAVLNQLPADHPHYYGINPYYLGFEIFNDIKRMYEKPEKDDPTLLKTAWVDEINYAVANFNDSSFISQYLSPFLIKKLKLFCVSTTEDDENYNVTGIHAAVDYAYIREKLADQYNIVNKLPQFTVLKYTPSGSLVLTVKRYKNNKLDMDRGYGASQALSNLWNRGEIYFPDFTNLTDDEIKKLNAEIKEME